MRRMSVMIEKERVREIFKKRSSKREREKRATKTKIDTERWTEKEVTHETESSNNLQVLDYIHNCLINSVYLHNRNVMAR